MFKKLKSDLNTERSFLFRKWHLTYSVALEIDPNKAGTYLDALLRAILLPEILSEKRSEDFSGALQPDVSKPDRLAVFSASGQVKISENEVEEFTATLESPFNGFKGEHHIIHSYEAAKSPNLPSFINVAKIGRLIPLRIRKFDIAFQLYQSKHTIFLGYNPVPLEHFGAGYEDGSLTIDIRSESQDSKSNLPLAKHDLLKKITHEIRKIDGFDLTEEIGHHL